jgi:cytochrome c oxidase subunit III
VATSTATEVGHATQPIVAHHFNNIRQQQATQRFGMWLFLVTEILFFGGVLCAYTAYRIWYPKEFEAGSTALNPLIATINSFILLTSSLTAMFGVRAAYRGRRSGLKLWLAVTMVLGLAFLGLKAREYSEDINEGLVPSPAMTSVIEPGPDGQPIKRTVSVFSTKAKEALEHKRFYREDGGKNLQDVDLERVQLFFVFYYSMTGLHVLHMVIGIGLFAWQFVLASTGFFDHKERYVYVEVLSLYWHFVELVWIFLLPLLYMAGHHAGNPLYL